MTQLPITYDLEERTSRFGENVIGLCTSLQQNAINRPIIGQLVRSATSVGANYREANNACSRKDFRNKIFICKKECEESKHWFRMLLKCHPDKNEQIKDLQKEAQELTMIFQKILTSLQKPKVSVEV